MLHNPCANVLACQCPAHTRKELQMTQCMLQARSRQSQRWPEEGPVARCLARTGKLISHAKSPGHARLQSADSQLWATAGGKRFTEHTVLCALFSQLRKATADTSWPIRLYHMAAAVH